MKQLLLFIFSIATIPSFFSCNSHHSSFEDDILNVADIALDSTAVVKDTDAQRESLPPKLNERDFVRTASLKFKADNVGAAIIETENKVRSLGGYVSLSIMRNFMQDSGCVQKTEDSSIRTVRYLPQAELVLRLPDDKLDSLLATLAGTSTMMYQREIHCDDVSINLLENKLKSERAATTGLRLKTDIDHRGKRLSEIGDVEKSIEEKDAANDEAKITWLNLGDAVKYSTVSIEISQEPVIQYTEIASEKMIPEYKASYLTQLGKSFYTGWQFLKDLTIIFVRFWSALFVIGIVLIFLRKRRGNFSAWARLISKG